MQKKSMSRVIGTFERRINSSIYKIIQFNIPYKKASVIKSV